MSESYKERFDSAMGHLGIKLLGELNQKIKNHSLHL